MTNNNDFGFDDAFIAGGVIGFLEDASKTEGEQRELSESEEEALIEDDLEDAVHNLKRQDEIIRSAYPEFSDWVIRTAIRQREEHEMKRMAQEILSEFNED